MSSVDKVVEPDKVIFNIKLSGGEVHSIHITGITTFPFEYKSPQPDGDWTTTLEIGESTTLSVSYNQNINLSSFPIISLGFLPGDAPSLSWKNVFYDLADNPTKYYPTSPVPAPATIWLFISGLITLFGFRRKSYA